MKNKSNLIVLISIIIAIVLGIYFPKFINEISFIGTIYINLLKFMIIPVIFTSVCLSIYNSKKIKGSFLLKTVCLFIIMFIVSFLITSLVMFIIKPGINYSFKFVEWASETTSIRYQDVLINLFPSNIASIFQNNSIFSVIILSIVFSMACIKTKSSELIKIIEQIKNVSYKILEYIMYLTPLAIISLLGGSIANYGNVIFDMGGKYILMVYLCSLIVMILVMILPVWIFAHINPFTYVRKLLKVWVISITTCSSVATLPTTIKTCNEELNIPSNITNITVPLGCTIHMCGGAVSFAILGIFCFQLFSINISILEFVFMILSATLINMAAPGIPNGGIVIGASFLSLLGLPLVFIGFYSSIYKLLDMSYTTLNVTGDITANILINKYMNKK